MDNKTKKKRLCGNFVLLYPFWEYQQASFIFYYYLGGETKAESFGTYFFKFHCPCNKYEMPKSLVKF